MSRARKLKRDRPDLFPEYQKWARVREVARRYGLRVRDEDQRVVIYDLPPSEQLDDFFLELAQASEMAVEEAMDKAERELGNVKDTARVT